MATLIDHVEHYLGPIVQAWQKNADGDHLPFMVCEFTPPTFPNTRAFTTLGLSQHPLTLANTGRKSRLEFLVFTNFNDNTGSYVPAILQQIANEFHLSGQAPLRGSVLGPRGRIVPETGMEAFYCAIPVYLPDDFATYRLGEESSTFIWLLPIYASEAKYVQEHGWENFEELLLSTDPDLIDWNRPPLKVQATDTEIH